MKIIIILISCSMMFFQCQKTFDSTRHYSKREKRFIDSFLVKTRFKNNVELLPVVKINHGFRFYLYEGWGDYVIILTFTKISEDYYVQLIENIESTKVFIVKETILNDLQKLKLEKALKDIENIAFDLDSNRLLIDLPGFEFVYKNNKNIIASIGYPSVYSNGKGGNEDVYINKQKQQLLSMVCWLAKICGIKKGEKEIHKGSQDEQSDSINYTVFIKNSLMIKEGKLFLDNKLLKVNNKGWIAISKEDTVNLYNRLKVVETQWDGETIEY